ncbi:hypothetical protein [Pseudomonas juntendi]|uniref:hypothetical protein n=1 Tax=Pseudomonas juntendi TaxID=2666183 RepID=UPI003B9461EF
MATLKEIQVQKVHSLIQEVKNAVAKGDVENVIWNWGRAHSYASCLQSCGVIDPEEASKLQHLAVAAKGGMVKPDDHPMDKTLKAEIVIFFGILACVPAIGFFQSQFLLSGPRVTALLCFGCSFPFYLGYRLTNNRWLQRIAVALAILSVFIFSIRID